MPAPHDSGGRARIQVDHIHGAAVFVHYVYHQRAIRQDIHHGALAASLDPDLWDVFGDGDDIQQFMCRALLHAVILPRPWPCRPPSWGYSAG